MSELSVTTYQWLVTGEPGSGYPSYSHVFTDQEYAEFFCSVVLHGEGRTAWAEGPFLWKVEVVKTPTPALTPNKVEGLSEESIRTFQKAFQDRKLT